MLTLVALWVSLVGAQQIRNSKSARLPNSF
uniref:Uncharacterized protein n=1 Tax=Arundo donax TaxID=35708 RepID=A0A0A9CGS1_ARUDO